MMLHGNIPVSIGKVIFEEIMERYVHIHASYIRHVLRLHPFVVEVASQSKAARSFRS